MRILDDIVQERGADGLIVEMQPCKDIGDVERMDDVGIARDAHLPAMRILRIGVCLLNLCEVGIHLIGAHLVQNHIYGNDARRII